MALPIITYGNPELKKKANLITERSPDIDRLIFEMYDTIVKSNAVGLAAPQVDRLLSLFIVIYNDFNQVFINPEIIEYSTIKGNSYEGCLSIPDISNYVVRSKKIKIKYFDADFKYHIAEYTNDIAYIIQHEYDHLNGVLFTDLISPLSKKIINNKLEKIRKKKFNVKYRTK